MIITHHYSTLGTLLYMHTFISHYKSRLVQLYTHSYHMHVHITQSRHAEKSQISLRTAAWGVCAGSAHTIHLVIPPHELAHGLIYSATLVVYTTCCSFTSHPQPSGQARGGCTPRPQTDLEPIGLWADAWAFSHSRPEAKAITTFRRTVIIIRGKTGTWQQMALKILDLLVWLGITGTREKYMVSYFYPSSTTVLNGFPLN